MWMCFDLKSFTRGRHPLVLPVRRSLVDRSAGLCRRNLGPKRYHHHKGDDEMRPLDDPTYYIRSAFNQLGLWRELYDCSRHKVRAPKCHITYIFVDLQPFGCNFKGRLLDPRFGVGSAWEVGDGQNR